MAEQIFISPSVKFSETDLTFVNQTLNDTSLGLIGETPKGPAFEPVVITSVEQIRTIFGERSTEKLGSKYKYLTNYYAESYLQESNNLTVTRVLGLSGYDAGKGWAIVANGAPDLTTVSALTSNTFTDVSFTGGTLFGFDLGTTIGEITTGRTDFVRVGNEYSATTYIFETTAINPDLSGVTNYTAVTQSYLPLAEYEQMVLGIVRSRADYSLNDLTFRTTGLTISSTGNTALNDLLGEFVLESTGAVNNDSYIVSLDRNKRSFIKNVLGDKPKGKENLIYVEALYPELVNKLNADGSAFGVSASLVELTGDAFTNYLAPYQTPITPWVVSELKGSEIPRLFRFVSISDGTSANSQIKISIQNIDLRTREFSVVIRDFNDTDANPIVLESFTRCSMIKDDVSYIGRRIGAVDSNNDTIFAFKSSFVYLELNTEADDFSIPCGFEGYLIRDYSASNTGSSSALAPKMYYKSFYKEDDKIRKVYLGISETAFGLPNGVNQNIFNYTGAVTRTSAYTKTDGFHLDSGATGTYVNGTFQVGLSKFQTANDLLDLENVYNQVNSAKFTLVPYGGFDGWDEHRITRTSTGLFKKGRSLYLPDSDYYAYLQGIDTFSNSESVTVNIIATPGLDWDSNLELVNDTIDMVEDERLGDSIYVIDAPDLPSSKGMAEEYADLIVDKDFDTSYACTYAPYIKINDNTNSAQIFIPPTGEVLKSFAFTDRVKGAWFAPAGLTRGVVDAVDVRHKLKLEERDTLYEVGINPITYFKDTGIAIFGQKTLQQRESALDRVNVRRLLIYLRQLIANISIRLVFEQNDETLRTDFKNKVNPILERVQRERGLTQFRIIMDETNNTPEVVDRKEIRGKILLKPTPSAEFFNINFTLLPTGASFDNI